MKKLLIATYDLEIGGVERSLISLLEKLDYSRFHVDLLLYRHQGEFLTMLPESVTLLEENRYYRTFRMSIKETAVNGQLKLAVARTFAKLRASFSKGDEKGVRQMQYMWKYSTPFLPALEQTYDVAISYLWPHNFVADKVQADIKIAWIHTDFSSITTDKKEDLKVWSSYQSIIAISEECAKAFVRIYPELTEKVKMIENITSPEMVKSLANEEAPEIQPGFSLVTVARLSHAKGIDRAVKVLHSLHQQGFSDIKWYIVGYGGDEEMIRMLIKEKGLEDSFILLGKKINPYPYMRKADLYIQPSRYEGKAVTVGEAQILGKPVIITNYPTAVSQVKDGYDGVICEQSEEGLTKAIISLYQQPEKRAQLSQNCQNSNYHNAAELEKLYQLV
ncbi:capsular polysaccharide biosynthesis protein [Jeotgalibacillus malaysiensis]|uniref:Capsular polysaccharide biosynthesis protein n=1 Tax=Jeotgalibacillus malaysiensis TaxID=1508404 RepID=A0A0B5AVG0_9BACL|nr:glycosyltransferase [Jeotgalibacillus malaysiensis]AJD92707.1 capsular polysaccharide biosynthesis protein [Jeotgalibacillus malaysiensis]